MNKEGARHSVKESTFYLLVRLRIFHKDGTFLSMAICW